jgi:hypothetical protein
MGQRFDLRMTTGASFRWEIWSDEWERWEIWRGEREEEVSLMVSNLKVL